jgi:hypothetical protein
MGKHKIIRAGTQIVFNCGDTVEHGGVKGRVVASFNTGLVRVQWSGTKEKSDHHPDDLDLVKRYPGEKSAPAFNPDLRPKTVAVSPRAQLERIILKQRR